MNILRKSYISIPFFFFFKWILKELSSGAFREMSSLGFALLIRVLVKRPLDMLIADEAGRITLGVQWSITGVVNGATLFFISTAFPSGESGKPRREGTS